MFKVDVAELATTEWVSPIVLVPTDDGSLRFCVDYRRLNTEAERDTFPIPRMNEFIDFLGETRIFSSLNAISGYW